MTTVTCTRLLSKQHNNIAILSHLLSANNTTTICRHKLHQQQPTQYHTSPTTQAAAATAKQQKQSNTTQQQQQSSNIILPPKYYKRKIHDSSRNALQRMVPYQQLPDKSIVNSELLLPQSLSNDNAHDLPYIVTPNNYHTLDHLTQPHDSNFVVTLERPFQWIRTQPPTIYPIEYTNRSIRCGLIGEKLGMLQLWTHWGEQVTVTAIRVLPNYVLQIKHEINQKGRIGLQLCSRPAKTKNLSKSVLVHYKKAGVMPCKTIHEFQITPDAVIPVGAELDVRHFNVGQYVDITGYTIGKGFTGAMKRWNFGGQPATHGVSLTHRSIGSTGSAQDPGHVFKGKKMAGRMGNERNTKLNNMIYKIDIERQLIYVKGSVVGNKGNVVILRDAIKKQFEEDKLPPMPTFIKDSNTPMTGEIILPHSELDPFRFGEE